MCFSSGHHLPALHVVLECAQNSQILVSEKAQLSF
jgi:hypothetical protein